MPGALTPITRWQILDNGVIAPGAKLYTFQSGTSTPLPVYNNADLDISHAHANPVVADAEGVLPVIFLSPVAYRFLVTDAAGATIFPAQDDITSVAEAAASDPDPEDANVIYAGPATGSAAVPTFRALVLADLPTLPSTKPLMQWGAQSNQPPASAYATPDTRNSHLVLDFDGSTDEEAVFSGVLPPIYAGGGLTCELYVALTSATSGSMRWQAAIERIDASVLDVDADSFAAFQSAGGTAPATSGMVVVVTILFTNGSQMDSLAAGEAFRLKVRRDADGTSGTDDIASDAELLRVVLRET